MNIYQAPLIRFLWISLFLAVLMGCGGKPAQFKQTAGEMKEGPGVLTGEEGAFVIYDSKKGGGFWERDKEKSEEASEQAGKEARAISDKPSETIQAAADQTSKGAQVTPEEAKEFQEFQQWKKEQQSFKEFQQWKKSEAGKAEYQEFLKWKEWKSYQEWKKQQNQ